MLLVALGRAAKSRPTEFTVQQLANIAWALAKTDQRDEALLAVDREEVSDSEQKT